VDNTNPGPDWQWFPQEVAATTIDIGDSATFVLGLPTTIWDVFRIDYCTLVLDYSFSDGNTSAELCITLDGGVHFFPFLSVAATEVFDLTPEFYINKYTEQSQTPFYMTQGGIWIRGESALLTASSATGVVFWSAARLPWA
jgi:hypothetical protein